MQAFSKILEFFLSLPSLIEEIFIYKQLALRLKQVQKFRGVANCIAFLRVYYPLVSATGIFFAPKLRKIEKVYSPALPNLAHSVLKRSNPTR